jgi:hypothetical protein
MSLKNQKYPRTKKLYNSPDEAEYIKGRLVQLEYVIKMDQTRVDEKLFESKPEDRRKG